MNFKKVYHVCGCGLYFYSTENGKRLPSYTFFSERGNIIKNCPKCKDLLQYPIDIFYSKKEIKKFIKTEINNLKKRMKQLERIKYEI
ncbi:MAG: hypothetical protein QXP66_01825 [Candidatus Aenigmatarchaeota archaeon]